MSKNSLVANYETVFIATDFSPPAGRAVTFSRAFLDGTDAGVTVLHHFAAAGVFGPTAAERKAYEQGLHAKLQTICASLKHARPLAATGDNSATVIVDAAKRANADLCILGTAGRTGLSRLIIGSVAENVVRQAHCDVLTVPPGETEPKKPKRILVATDLSPASLKAVHRALSLSRLHGATLRIIHVYDPAFPIPGPDGGLMNESQRAETEFASLNDGIDALGPDFLELDRAVHSSSSPADGVIDAADDFDADLVVVGSHGRSGIGRFLIGSVAERTVRGAGRPVLVVRNSS